MNAECGLRNAECSKPKMEMKDEEKEDLEEAKELLKDGLFKILKATGKISKKIVDGFREGYAKDVNDKKGQT